MPLKLCIFLLLLSCSHLKAPHNPDAPKEFAPGELILGSQLLMKIYDKEMAPIECVPDTEEASLLLRTIHPRMEVVQDDIEAQFDNPEAITTLIQSCDKNCSCHFLDDLLREHLVTLSRAQHRELEAKKTQKELNRCLSYFQETFCKSELYQELNKEKVDFSFDE